MKKTALLLIIVTIIAKLTGFIKDIVLSYFYGVSNISDIYLISLTIPVGIFAFVGAAISTGYIPMFSKIEKEQGRIEANRYTSNLINMILLICTIIIVLGFIFTKEIVFAFASGFEGQTLDLAIKFTKISLISIYAMGLTYVFNGFLQIKDNYIAPALMLLPLNILTMLAIVLSNKYEIDILASGTLIATFSQVMFLLPFLKKNGFKYQLTLDFNDIYIKKMAWIAMPVIIGSSVNQINVLLDRTIASNIIVGGVSALTYANKMSQFIQGIFVLTIATILYPAISRMIAENNISGFKKSIRDALLGVSLLVIPATIGTIIFSKELVQLLFGRGAFDEKAVMLTTTSLLFYSIGMIGFGYREILSRSYYAMQDTFTPMKNAILGMLLNIVLNIILSRYLGISGLALATSISAIVTSLLLFISLRKKIGSFGIRYITISFLKIIFASTIMGLLAKLSFKYLTTILNINLSLLIAIMIGIILYCIVIYFMKIDDIDIFVKSIKQKYIGKPK